MKGFTAAAAGLLLAASRALADTSPISIKGAKFFHSDGSQYYMKGIAYQLTEDDPLADSTQCQLDIDLMKTLGTNAIRVYHVDPTADHDTCMGALSDAGIYAFIDLDTFDTYILQDSPTWNNTQYTAYQKVMDAFHNYDNVGGFFVGNEVLTTGEGSIAAPYVKAAARDMKAYRDQQGYRKIPIGYSAADIPSLRPNLQNYLACGGNSSESLDFFSLNAYEWCGQNTYEGSGYSMLQQNASDYNIPIFFSETGCMTPKPRTFDDQSAILGSEMDGTWSGAIIYEWIEEQNDYGLISYGPSAQATATGAGVVGGFTRTGTPTPISPDFSNLSNQWKTLNPSGVNSNDYNPTNSAPQCPGYTSGEWEVSSDAPLPTLGQAASFVPTTGTYSTGRASQTAGSSGSASGGNNGGSASGSATGSSSGSASGGAAASASSSASAAFSRRAEMPLSDLKFVTIMMGVIAVSVMAIALA